MTLNAHMLSDGVEFFFQLFTLCFSFLVILLQVYITPEKGDDSIMEPLQVGLVRLWPEISTTLIRFANLQGQQVGVSCVVHVCGEIKISKSHLVKETKK